MATKNKYIIHIYIYIVFHIPILFLIKATGLSYTCIYTHLKLGLGQCEGLVKINEFGKCLISHRVNQPRSLAKVIKGIRSAAVIPALPQTSAHPSCRMLIREEEIQFRKNVPKNRHVKINEIPSKCIYSSVDL